MGKRRTFYQYIFIGIRKPFAIGRPDGIDAAIVIGTQKGAGCRANHIIALLIQPEILFDELAFLYFEMTGDAFDIRCFEPG